MSAMFVGYIQLKNCDFKVKNKQSVIGVDNSNSFMKLMSEKAGLHENWWKSFWFHLMQTDHNLCLNPCFNQSLTFAIWELKWTLFQNGTKDLNF